MKQNESLPVFATPAAVVVANELVTATLVGDDVSPRAFGFSAEPAGAGPAEYPEITHENGEIELY